jgi:hypothetical protein
MGTLCGTLAQRVEDPNHNTLDRAIMESVERNIMRALEEFQAKQEVLQAKQEAALEAMQAELGRMRQESAELRLQPAASASAAGALAAAPAATSLAADGATPLAGDAGGARGAGACPSVRCLRRRGRALVRQSILPTTPSTH